MASASNNQVVEHLPADILNEIFLLHVWENLDTPVRLCLVSKFWCCVAAHAPKLWGRIYYGDPPSPETLEDEQALPAGIDGMITCTTPGRLNKAIEKTQMCGFELTLCRSGPAAPLKVNVLKTEAFSTYCRRVHPLDKKSFNDVCALVVEVPFMALKEFCYHHDRSMEMGELGEWGEALEVHSPNITNLFTTWCPVDNEPYPDIFNRINKLTIKSWWQLNSTLEDQCSPPPRSILANLEELTVIYYKRMANSVQSLDFLPEMPRLTRLSLSRTRCDLLPIPLMGQITHLTLNCFEGWIFRHPSSGHLLFLNLAHLVVNGSWADLVRMRAPRLVTLMLRNAKCPLKLQYWRDNTIALVPEVLHMDIWMPRHDVLGYLRNNGRNLREIYFTFLTPKNDDIDKKIVQPLIVKGEKDRICPQLRRLDLLVPIEQDEGHNTRRNLQNIIKDRGKLGHLQRLRYGRYPDELGRGGLLDAASQKWWKVEWDELLWL